MSTNKQNFRRVFTPPATWITVATVALLALFIGMGRWQWGRGAERQTQWEAFERGGGEPVAIEGDALARQERFTRVRLRGRYDAERQFLLDNRSVEGRPGYEVLTILRLADGTAIPVDRGWVPFDGYRDRMPKIPVTDEPRDVIGRIEQLPSAGLESGRAAPTVAGAWPQVTSFPRKAELEAAWGGQLLDGMLLLDPGEPDGYLRKWRPPGLEPAKHQSYAIQWWGFAVLLTVLYIGLNFRPRESRS